MKINWKATGKEILEFILYYYVCMIPYRLLVHYGYIEDVGMWWLLLSWVITVILGGYVIEKYNEYLFRRKMMRVAKEMAKAEGVDPKSVTKKDVVIKRDKDGIVEVEVRVRKKKEKGDGEK